MQVLLDNQGGGGCTAHTLGKYAYVILEHSGKGKTEEKHILANKFRETFVTRQLLAWYSEIVNCHFMERAGSFHVPIQNQENCAFNLNQTEHIKRADCT